LKFFEEHYNNPYLRIFNINVNLFIKHKFMKISTTKIIKASSDAKQKCEVRVTQTKMNEREPVKLLLHKRQVTKIEKYKNEKRM